MALGHTVLKNQGQGPSSPRETIWPGLSATGGAHRYPEIRRGSQAQREERGDTFTPRFTLRVHPGPQSWLSGSKASWGGWKAAGPALGVGALDSPSRARGPPTSPSCWRRAPPPPAGAPVPVWAALTQRREPSSGKPRRTGRRSSFYRRSNWGWSRRGNTKILCTQLLSVRAGTPAEAGAARDTFALCGRRLPGSAFHQASPGARPRGGRRRGGAAGLVLHIPELTS